MTAASPQKTAMAGDGLARLQSVLDQTNARMQPLIDKLDSTCKAFTDLMESPKFKSPNFKSRAAVQAHLHAAQNDPAVTDPDVRVLVEILMEIVEDGSIEPLLKLVKKHESSEAANKRHATRRQAEEWVRAEWTKHRDAYSDNKSRFARRYCKLVADKFGFEVTPETIKTRWLKGR